MFTSWNRAGLEQLRSCVCGCVCDFMSELMFYGSVLAWKILNMSRSSFVIFDGDDEDELILWLIWGMNQGLTHSSVLNIIQNLSKSNFFTN